MAQVIDERNTTEVVYKNVLESVIKLEASGAAITSITSTPAPSMTEIISFTWASRHAI